LVVGALSLGACAAVCAQTAPADSDSLRTVRIQAPASGSLAGRLTDLHSAPLAGVPVVLHNLATGAEVHAVTAKNGAFRFAELEAGQYSLEADEPQLGHGRLEGILVTGGMEARVQAAMHFELAAPSVVEAAAPGEIAAAPRSATPIPLTAFVPPEASRPAAVLPLPTVSREALSTSIPELVALVATEPLRTMAPESLAVDAAPPSNLPVAPQQTAVLPLPTASRAALSTATPQVAALIATEPLRTMNITPRAAEAVSPSSQPIVSQPVAPQPAAPKLVVPQPASARAEVLTAPPAMPTPQLRAALETQSVAFEPALAIALPQTFPLTSSMAPFVALNMAAASGMKAVLLLGQTGLSPVRAAAQEADPAAAVVATTVTATQLESLPAGGRRWQEFLLDTPVASSSTGSTPASYRGSQESAEITIDGASTTLKFGAAAGSGAGSTANDPAGQGADQQSAMSQAWTGGRGFGVSESAIHEVTATAGNVEAEGMRSAGGRTGIQTERGGNALHGQGFYFDRQNTWGARNPFTQWVTETAPMSQLGMLDTVPVFDNGPAGSPESYTPPDHEIVWGLGMGSRIRRDKLFWFAALDSYRRNDPGMAMVKHPYLKQIPSGCGTTSGCTPSITGLFAQPSDAQMQLLSAQLDLPSASPVNEALTAYSCMLETLAGMPGGTSPNCPPLAGNLGPAPRTAAQWVGFGRIDWQAAERHHFTLEGTGADWNAPGGGLTQVSENYGSHSFGSSQANEEWLLARWEAYLTPNLLAVAQGSAGRTILSARPGAPSALEQNFLEPNVPNIYGQLPQIVVDTRYGFTIGNPSRFGQGSYPDEKLYHAQEKLDWVHNRLLVKAGFELDHDADATSMLRNQTGTYIYSEVQDFISDALAFEKFGFADALDTANPHNCGATDTTWGSQPCYSSYSQTVGPSNWHLSTNDWSSYATAQWQPNKIAVFSAGLRWEREQLPPPLAALANPELTESTQGYSTPPFSANLPSLGNDWSPRVSVAVSGGKRWPVLRLGYGMYYGRVENATLETALTQTGSLNGDLNFFMRPQDDCQRCAGGAPPFPYVFAGQPASVVKPGAVGFAPNFRNPEVHQAVAAVEQSLPGGITLTAGAMLSLGRRLPVSIDANIDPAVNPRTLTYNVCETAVSSSGSTVCGNLGLGPIKTGQITVPYYADWPAAIPGNCPVDAKLSAAGQCGRLNPDYQQIAQIMSRANSTYEAAMVKIVRLGRRGLSLHAHYTYAHAMDWNPDGITLGADSSVLAPPSSSQEFSQEYGTSNLDVRHSAAVMAIFEAPWKLRGPAGRFGNGWMLSGIGQFRSGLPYSMRVTGSIPSESNSTIIGLGPSLNGFGGDNRFPGLPRNTFRYPNAWKADLRLGKKFDLGEMRELEVLAESFNLFNHQNVTAIETTGYYIENSGSSGEPPTINFLAGLKTNSATGLPISAFGQPLDINGSDFYRERQIQIGVKMRF
jgi:hypothetical protein